MPLILIFKLKITRLMQTSKIVCDIIYYFIEQFQILKNCLEIYFSSIFKYDVSIDHPPSPHPICISSWIHEFHCLSSKIELFTYICAIPPWFQVTTYHLGTCMKKMIPVSTIRSNSTNLYNCCPKYVSQHCIKKSQ